MKSYYITRISHNIYWYNKIFIIIIFIFCLIKRIFTIYDKMYNNSKLKNRYTLRGGYPVSSNRTQRKFLIDIIHIMYNTLFIYTYRLYL